MANQDRDYNVRRLAKRLQRIDKQMSGMPKTSCTLYVDGDVKRFAEDLPANIRESFSETMKTLRDADFLKLLDDYPRARQRFVEAPTVVDTVVLSGSSSGCWQGVQARGLSTALRSVRLGTRRDVPLSASSCRGLTTGVLMRYANCARPFFMHRNNSPTLSPARFRSLAPQGIGRHHLNG